MGLKSLFVRSLAVILCLSLVLMFAPGIPPHVTFSPVEVEPTRPLEGPLMKNNILDNAERLYEGFLMAPESIASRADDEIFVSVYGGDIIRIWGDNWDKSEVVTTIGPGCAGPLEEHICGRPLGLRFGNDGRLLVADAYLGIFAVDVDTGKKERLVDPSDPIEGMKPLLTDDLDIDLAGNIYWSDASAVSNLADGLISFLADPTGRLIRYNPKTKTNTVLMSNLHFANGVQLSPDHSFVLVAETFFHRVHRYWLKGPKAGTSDIFVARLPGMPDNIRARKNGGYYVSLVECRDSDFTDIFDATSKLPALRRLVIRIAYIVKLIFSAINDNFPNAFAANVASQVLHIGALKHFYNTNMAMVVELDEHGNIRSSLQGYSGRVSQISQTNHVGNDLFFGSPFVPYLGRLKLDEPLKSKVVKKDDLDKERGKKDEL